MTSVKVRLNLAGVTQEGLYPLVFQLLRNRKKRIISTPYRVARTQFDSDAEQAVCILGDDEETSKIREINQYLSVEKDDLLQIITNLSTRNRSYTVLDIVEMYNDQKTRTHLIVLLRRTAEEWQHSGRVASSHTYKSTLSILTRFGCPDNMAVGDITVDFLKRFMRFMQEEKLQPNSVALYMRILRAIYNRAIDMELVDGIKDPFRRIRIRGEKTIKRAIDRNTLLRVANLNLTDYPSLVFSRDLFLFSFYTRGMSFVDMAFLQKSNIHNGFITYRRHKTNQQLKIKVSSHLLMLINHYPGTTNYVLPILNGLSETPVYTQYKTALRKHNQHLKQIGEMLGLEIKLTSYVARHTWATLAKRSGIPTSIISEGLGHSNEKTTAIYLSSFDNEVIDNANEIVTTLNTAELTKKKALYCI